MKQRWNLSLLLAILVGLGACKTKMDVQREQDLERIKQDIRTAKGTKADLDVVTEQMRTELTRMTNYVEEQTIYQRRQTEELKQEILAVAARLEALEQRIKAKEEAEKEAEKAPPANFEIGQRMIDNKQYDEATEVFREIVRKNANANDVRKARYLLAESLFLGENYATAALEYSEYKRAYPKDSRMAEATFRQAQAFKSLGKKKEAKLFFQELVEKYPKSTLVPRAKNELKQIK